MGSECPHWLEFLGQITQRDDEFAAYLQRVVGYAASGWTREHTFWFIYGPGGNGKGTFLNTLQYVLGDYAMTAPMETFTESRNDRHPTELAMLRGARLAVAQETEEGRAWAESRIKSLTGGDPISARRMRQDFFTFQPEFKLLIAGNHKPKLRNVDEAMKRRLQLLPFTVSFQGEECDPNLGEALRAEAGGILRWIVEGALEYQRIGLAPPDVVLEATNEYFSAENLFHQWIEDCCECSPDFWAKPTPLFQSWKHYAENAGEAAGAQKDLVGKLESAGFEKGKTGGKGRFYKGLKIKSYSAR
jgi:putative DNA primase/helicase